MKKKLALILLCLIPTFYSLYKIIDQKDYAFQINKVMGHEGNAFDDISTITSVHNFSKDGFNFPFIPNRKGNIGHDLYNVPCYTKNESKAATNITDVKGKELKANAILNDCYYTRSGPLTEYVSYFLYRIFGSFTTLKYFNLIISSLTAIVIFLIIESFTKTSIATLVTLIYTTSYSYWGQQLSLYNINLQELFLSFFVLTLISKRNASHIFLAILGFFISYTSNEYVLYALILTIIYEKKVKNIRVFSVFIGLVSAQALYYLQKVFFFDSMWKPIQDISNAALKRYGSGDQSYFELLFDFIQKVPYYFTTNFINVVSLVIIIIMAFKMIKEKRGLLLAFLLASVSFTLLLPKNALIHTHLYYRHFILFSLIALSFCLSEIQNKKFKIILYISLALSFIHNSIYFTKDLNFRLKQRKIYSYQKNLIDILFWQQSSQTPWVTHGRRYNFIDNNYELAVTTSPIYTNEQFDFGLLYLEDQSLDRVYIHSTFKNMPQITCESYDENNKKMDIKSILQKDHLIEITLLKTHFTKLYYFKCKSMGDLHISEISY